MKKIKLSDDEMDYIIVGGPRPKTKREFYAYVWLGVVCTIILIVLTALYK